jgi:exopolyphosphatase / guanosine-5'-triphosphate,3'-diphosphate pyrophosphatase
MDIEYYGAIDVGTNSGKLLIGYIIGSDNQLSIKKAHLSRIPLRLGEDVYSDGKISSAKLDQLNHTFTAFKHLMKAYNVKAYHAVATSAMREAENSTEICKTLYQNTGIDLEIIDGKQEADYLFTLFKTQNINHSKSYLFVDVGGGSTELTIVKNGVRHKSKSFKLGSLRAIKVKPDLDIWKTVENWLTDNCCNGDQFTAIGTGGNINRILKFTKKKHLKPLNVNEIQSILNNIASYSAEDRVDILGLKPDRADVIIPAGEIYLKLMRMAGIDEIIVPKIGVSDGIIYNLYLQGKH